MTIQEATPIILDAFNTTIENKAAQDLFALRLSLWNGATAKYSTESEYAAVFAGWKDRISTDLLIMQKMTASDPSTRKITSTHEKGTSVTVSHEGENITTQTAGESTTKNTVYPTGYTGEIDEEYLATAINNDETTDTTTFTPGVTDTTTNTGSDTDTVDEFTYADFLAATDAHKQQFVATIDECVFDCFVSLSVRRSYETWL